MQQKLDSWGVVECKNAIKKTSTSTQSVTAPEDNIPMCFALCCAKAETTELQKCCILLGSTHQLPLCNLNLTMLGVCDKEENNCSAGASSMTIKKGAFEK